MNTYETLLRFCNINDDFHEFTRRPFPYELNGKNVAVATDGRLLCVAKFGCTDAVQLAGTKIPNIAKVIPPEDCAGHLSLKSVYDALDKVPMKHDTECPECGGDGKVRFEYYCEADSTTHYHNFDCPYCAGIGFVDESKAPLIYDTYYSVRIDNQPFFPKYLKRLADILSSLDLTDAPYCVNTAIHTLKIETPEYIMLLSGCVENDDKDKNIEL